MAKAEPKVKAKPKKLMLAEYLNEEAEQIALWVCGDAKIEYRDGDRRRIYNDLMKAAAMIRCRK